MQAPLLTEVPSSLKQLARLVVRGFYDIEYSLIVDMLVRWLVQASLVLLVPIQWSGFHVWGKMTSVTCWGLTRKCWGELCQSGALQLECWFLTWKVKAGNLEDGQVPASEVEDWDWGGRESQQSALLLHQLQGKWKWENDTIFVMFKMKGFRKHCEVQAGPHAQEDGDWGERRHQQE